MPDCGSAVYRFSELTVTGEETLQLYDPALIPVNVIDWPASAVFVSLLKVTLHFNPIPV